MYFLDPSLQTPINHSWSTIVAGVVVTSLNNTTVMPPTLSTSTQVQHLHSSLAALQPQFSANYGGLFTKKLSTEHTDCLHTWVRTEDHGTTPMVDTPEEMCGLLSIKIIN